MSGKTEIELRPCVRQFAEAMEMRLRKHDSDRGERGWARDQVMSLMFRLTQESAELLRELAYGVPEHTSINPPDVQQECADVGAFAMMIFDITQERGNDLFGRR